MNSFSAATKPTQESVEYYTTTHYRPIAMFVKRVGKVTLVENYEEAKKVEADMDSITNHTLELELKHTTIKIPLLLTKPKQEHSNELGNVVKMVQKLSNKVVDLEKDKGASSYRNPFNPYYKKREDSEQPKPPIHKSVVLNFNKVGMDHFCTFHQEPHSEKSYPQWVNLMNLVMNQLLDTQWVYSEEEQAQTNEPEQTNDETTMVLWDWEPTLGLSEDEPIEEVQM